MTGVAILLTLMSWQVVELCPVITPDICKCDAEDLVVDCTGIDSMPSMRDEAVNSSTVYEKLYLTDTAIHAIPPNAFGNVRFKEIDATGNEIDTIDDLAFAGTEHTLVDLKIRLSESAIFPQSALRILESLKSLTISNFGQEALPPGALNNLTSLENLTLNHGKLVNIFPDDLRDQMSTLKFLNLFNNRLSSFPTEVVASLSSLERLKISSNNIDQLIANAVQSDSLNYLDVSSQQMLKKVDDQSFNGVAKSLQTLIVTSSRLTDRNVLVFSKLKSLRYLDVSYNNFTNLAPLISSLTSLVYLNAMQNNIDTISRYDFQKTVTLQSIDLSYNSFKTFESDAFRDLTALESLNLQHTIGVTLDAGSFVGQRTSLRRLALNYVNLNVTQWSPFRSLAVLEKLLLHECQLGNIPDMTFSESPLLNTLVIGNNAITELNQKALVGTERSLRYVQLDNNQLTTIDRCAFYGFNEQILLPENVALDNNPLVCDCGIRPLYDWIQNRTNVEWHCSDGRRISSLDPKIFSECNSSISAEPCQNFTVGVATESTTRPDGTRTDDLNSPAIVPLIVAAGVFLSLLLIGVPLVVCNCVTSRRARQKLQQLEEAEPTLGSNTKRFLKPTASNATNPSGDYRLMQSHRMQSRSMDLLQTSDTEAVLTGLLTLLRDRPNQAVSLNNLDSIRYHAEPFASRAYVESEIYDEIDDDKLVNTPSDDTGINETE